MIKISNAKAKTVRNTVSKVKGSNAKIKTHIDTINVIDLATEAGQWERKARIGNIAREVYAIRKAEGMTDTKAKSADAVNDVWIATNGGLSDDKTECDNGAPLLDKTSVSRLRTVAGVLDAYLAQWELLPSAFPLGKAGIGRVNTACRVQSDADAILAMIPESEGFAGLSAKITAHTESVAESAKADPAKGKQTRGKSAKASAKAKATPASAKPADPATTTESGIPSEAPALAGIATADLLAELAKRVKTAKLTDSEARALGAIWDTQLAI